jgi:queuine/archaeosine tRNA-ribosyltransferase
LKAIRQKIRPETRIHLLGFAKAEQIDEFVQYDISSFDSTSPLIRAFKDARANYYLESPKGGLEYFAAIRVPQAMENPRLMQATKRGVLNAEETQRLEALALNNLRAYHKGTVALEEAMGHLMAYQRLLAVASSDREEIQVKELAKAEVTMRETLDARPWQRCKCAICRNIGVEVIIFRSSNRNKRRGMHNLGVYYQHLKRTLG